MRDVEWQDMTNPPDKPELIVVTYDDYPQIQTFDPENHEFDRDYYDPEVCWKCGMSENDHM